LESWTTRYDTAKTFAATSKGGKIGMIIKTTIPRERILFTPKTGFGCMTEEELVVLGGTSDRDQAVVDSKVDRLSKVDFSLSMEDLKSLE
jgi:hypothetical protein